MVCQDDPSRFRACALVIALVCGARSASADLPDDAERLAAAWTQRGATITRQAPVFAEHGQSRLVELPADDVADAKPGCTTLALLGAPTVDFSAALMRNGMPLDLSAMPDGHPILATEDLGVRSIIGAATIVRCNEARTQLARVAISMRSPRGAMEVLVARSPAPLGEPRDVLPERLVGVVAPRGNPGRPIEPGPLAQRVVRAEEQARADGAESFSRVSLVATPEGLGETRLRLSEGCHRISVMAAVPNSFPHRATDIDAEVRDEAGRVLATDRAETSDARLDVCLGETLRVRVVYGGASGAVPVIVTDAAWSMPAAVPNHWGARARGGFALALQRRHAPNPSAGPIVEAMGSAGATLVPVMVEPGRCYLAAVSLLRGEARGIRMSATVGDRFVREDVVDRPDGASLAFCSESDASARLEIDVRGNNVFWVSALFPLGGGGEP